MDINKKCWKCHEEKVVERKSLYYDRMIPVCDGCGTFQNWRENQSPTEEHLWKIIEGYRSHIKFIEEKGGFVMGMAVKSYYEETLDLLLHAVRNIHDIEMEDWT